MAKLSPGKNHRNRRSRGSVKERLRVSNPFQFALLYHDPQLAQEMRERSIVEETMWRKVDACCLTCHAPLIHAAAGIFYCPYERAGMEPRAREMLVGNSAGSREGRVTAIPHEPPAPSSYSELTA